MSSPCPLLNEGVKVGGEGEIVLVLGLRLVGCADETTSN